MVIIHKRLSRLSSCMDSNYRRDAATKVEPTNPYDDFAVSIEKDGAVVGHVPMSAELFASFSSGLKVLDFAK